MTHCWSTEKETVVLAEYEGTFNMAKRILTALIGVPLAIFVLWLNNTAVWIVCTTIISLLAVGEVLLATKYFSSKVLAMVCMVFVAALPSFLCIEVLYSYFPILCGLFLLAMFIIMLLNHQNVKFEEMTLMVFVSFLVPFSFSTIVYLQEKFEFGVYYMVLVFLIAWINDAGAYFVGSAFGKHPMASKISPKKSWEGFFGGLAAAIISVLIVGFGYPWVDRIINGYNSFTVNIPFLIGLAVLGTILGVVGDFSASLLKRQCNVKDYGYILPGHGGIMDRFDSILFVAPCFYLIFTFIEPVALSV